MKLSNSCVYVPLWVIVGTEGKIVDLVLILLAEPYSELRFYTLTFLLLQLKFFEFDDQLGRWLGTFGISPFRNSSRDLSKVVPKTGNALEILEKPRYLMFDI